jgi:hypothetical protein
VTTVEISDGIITKTLDVAETAGMAQRLRGVLSALANADDQGDQSIRGLLDMGLDELDKRYEYSFIVGNLTMHTFDTWLIVRKHFDTAAQGLRKILPHRIVAKNH